MSPDVMRLVARVQRRLHVRSIAWALAVGGLVFAATFIVLLIAFALSRSVALGVALAAGIAATLLLAVRRGASSIGAAAAAIERVNPGLDNLIVTAADIHLHPRPLRAEIGDEIERQAAARASTVDVRLTAPLVQPIAVAMVVVIGAVVLARTGTTTLPVALSAPRPQGQAPGDASFEVRITPPAYTGRRAEVLRDPVQIAVLEGTRIQIPAAARDWIATETSAIELRLPDSASPKFLSVVVTPDQSPSVRIVTPGKDSAFAKPEGQVDIAIETVDDLGLASLVLRYTKASGGGENVSFAEGEVPLRVERQGRQHWTAQATLALPPLDLADGDILVYRAIVRDSNPKGAPVQSEQYLIEIGKNAEIADAGFSLPSEEKKYAISQQMVIFKTEQLIAARKKNGAGAPEAWLEQTRGIAVEQRMVRAEVVFLGGGEVEDEVEEATHSNELTEGRLQNTGRVEMLRAINAMSRAETQLNDGRADEALVFEREALRSLERALDRRRYFLRTLPDRSRIDTGRRLTGERREARSWNRDASPTIGADALDANRRLMRDLAAEVTVDASLAARVAAVDPQSAPLQKAAVALASAQTDDAKRAAVRQAMRALTDEALRKLPQTMPIDVRRDALSGVLANELTGRPRQ